MGRDGGGGLMCVVCRRQDGVAVWGEGDVCCGAMLRQLCE